ncbi:MAG TPA: hypothetical protein VFV52_12145 [Bacilli bacterium]|nr:hypothetical protein [Bacilli bacterium]
MSLHDDLQAYGELVDDFEVSPFESLDMLHIRDSLEQQMAKLTEQQREQLKKFDLKLFLNAQKMYAHIGQVFNFDGKKPNQEWWWRLDQFVD